MPRLEQFFTKDERTVWRAVKLVCCYPYYLALEELAAMQKSPNNAKNKEEREWILYLGKDYQWGENYNIKRGGQKPSNNLNVHCVARALIVVTSSQRAVVVSKKIKRDLEKLSNKANILTLKNPLRFQTISIYYKCYYKYRLTIYHLGNLLHIN